MKKAGDPALDPTGAGLANSSASISVGDINIEGNVDGQIVIGNNNLVTNQVYNVKVHNQIGAVFNLQVEPTIQRHKTYPQPPRPPRGFVGRDFEQESLKKTIAGREATFVYGHDGLGKTSLSKQVANCDLANQMPDGVVFLESVDEAGITLGFNDLIQFLFDSFYLANPPLKANLANTKTHLSNTVPLVILDDFDLPGTAFDKLPDLFPHGALIVVSRKLSPVEDAYQPYSLSPLLREDAVKLFVRKSGQPGDSSTSAVLDRICELCGDVPLVISKLANLVRHKSFDLSDILTQMENTRPASSERIQAAIERGLGVVYAQLNDDEREALAVVAAAPGISVDRNWLESVVQDQLVVAELETMELIQANSPRIRMADGLRYFIREKPVNLDSHRSALLDHLLRELKSRSLDFEFIADELGNILGLLRWAAEKSRWADVVTLGRAVDPYLTLKGLWDAWENVLKLVLQAGQTLKDQAVQAWALHQLGSREIGIGSRGQAIRHLVTALRIREAMGDKVGAAYTRHNLNIITPPKPPDSSDKTRSPYNPPLSSGWVILGLLVLATILAAISFREPLASIFGFRAPTPAGCTRPDEWQEYIAQDGDTLDSISERVASAMGTGFSKQGLPLVKFAIRNANLNCEETILTPGIISTPGINIEPGQRIYVPEIPPNPPVVPVTEQPEENFPITMVISPTLNGAAEIREIGQSIGYIYDVANKGRRPLEGILRVTDDKVTEVTCPGLDAIGNQNGFFDPDEIITCTGTYNVTQADFDYGSVTNTAVAQIGKSMSSEETHIVELAQIPGLEISKKADPAIYTRVGQEITYLYTVKNSGNITLSPISIFVKDDHINNGDKEFICGPEGTELAPSEVVECFATYVITEADLEARSVTNNATVSIYGHRIKILDSEAATATVQYPLPPTLEKTVEPKEYDRVGQIIKYTYVVKNVNPIPLPGPVTVSDNLVLDGNDEPKETFPCSDVESLEADGIVTCTLEYAITQADLDRGDVTNIAVAHVGEIDSNQETLSITGIPHREITLLKSAMPVTYDSVGQTITYTYTIENTGNVTLGPEQFTISDDRINAGARFNCGSAQTKLAPDETIFCSQVYTITSVDMDTRSVTNRATAFGAGLTSTQEKIQIICPPPPSFWIVYVVQAGDTLYSISTWYRDTSAERLMQANCLSSTTIRPGQNLYVPEPPPPATIRGLVYYDANRDNNKDEEEEGIGDLTLELINLSTNSKRTTKTNEDGTYVFSDLKPGTYQIYQRVIIISKPGQVIPGIDFALHSVPPQ